MAQSRKTNDITRRSRKTAAGILLKKRPTNASFNIARHWSCVLLKGPPTLSSKVNVHERDEDEDAGVK